jgi:myo-inositol catabolism protein IolS
MKQRSIGKTDITISELGLGAWGLGGVYYGKVPFQQGVDAVRAYLDCGGNHLDTAFSYHTSEEIIGAAIKGYDRSKIVIASKTYAGTESEAEIADIRTHLEISLRDLGTDYVDLYYLHGSPENPDRMHRILDVYEKLKQEGKIRAIGASIRGPIINDASLTNAFQYIRSGRLDVIELAYSVLRQKHGQIFAEAHQRGVGVIARVVLESGLITGKYEPGHRFVWPDQRTRYGAELDEIFREGKKLLSLLPAGYKSTAELATQFVLSDPGVSGVILGGTTADQFRRSCAMDKLPPLPAELVAKLQSLYAPRCESFNPTGTLEHVDSPRRPLDGADAGIPSAPAPLVAAPLAAAPIVA